MASRPQHTPIKVSDVAKAAGVSSAVVYSFLNGRYYGNGEGSRIGVASATRARIRKVAIDLGFNPSDILSQIRLRPRQGGILFMLSESVSEGIANPYFSRIFQGLSTHAAETGRNSSFATFGQDVDFMAHPEALPESVLTGLTNKIVLGGKVNYSLVLALRRAECAVVYASRDLGLPEVPGVVPDYAEAARLAIDYLTSHGHRRIALACAPHVDPDAYYFKELTRSCEEAWYACDLPAPPPVFVFPEKENPQGIAYLNTIRSTVPGVTAIFSFDDYSAIDLLNAALGSGLRVPGDISVLGCNDEVRPMMTIPLSTIHFPKKLIGKSCAELLDQCLEPTGSKLPSTITLPVHLIERESVGSAHSHALV